MQFDNVNRALPALANGIMTYGSNVPSRLGETVREMVPVQFTVLNPWERAIIVPGRKVNIAAQVVETMWVLSGDDRISVIEPYLARAVDFSDDGVTWRGAYGPRIRRWRGEIDQLAEVVRMLREDPFTRRAVIQIYDPSVDLADGKDVPCNNWLSFRRNGSDGLDLHVAARSNDLLWGWSGINFFEWSVLLEAVARMTGMAIGRIHFSTTSLHIYDRHFDKARDIAQYRARSYGPSWTPPANPDTAAVARLPREGGYSMVDLEDYIEAFFVAERALRTRDLTSQGTEALDVAVETLSTDRTFSRFLFVIADYWGQLGRVAPTAPRRNREYMESLEKVAVENFGKARVETAAPAAPAADPLPREDQRIDEFLDQVNKLHETKHAAYGDSWKRRGEQVGILANIARKVDRLGKTDDLETAADTAIDLSVYLAKYRQWLGGKDDGPEGAAQAMREMMESTRHAHLFEDVQDDPENAVTEIQRFFDILLFDVTGVTVDEPAEVAPGQKQFVVSAMLRRALPLAYSEWFALEHFAHRAVKPLLPWRDE